MSSKYAMHLKICIAICTYINNIQYTSIYTVCKNLNLNSHVLHILLSTSVKRVQRVLCLREAGAILRQIANTGKGKFK